jgi:hypothetical protein
MYGVLASVQVLKRKVLQRLANAATVWGMKKTKLIEYSYPSSPNAERFKLSSGGYCVEIIKFTPERQPPIAIAGFKTIEEAERFAATLPEPFDTFTKRA